MRYKILFLIGLLAYSTTLTAQENAPNFPVTLQTANALLANAAIDTAKAQEASAAVLKCVDLYPKSSLVPEGLYVVSQLDQAIGNKDEAVSLAAKVASQFPEAESAPKAFEYALSAYCDLQKWQQAIGLGKQYMEHLDKYHLYPPTLLNLAEASLAEGNNEFAGKVLDMFLRRCPNLPQAVTARMRQGMVFEALGNRPKATESYSLAWSMYQKNKGKSEYSQIDVSHAAAVALWKLESIASKSFQDDAQTDLSEKQLRRKCDEIVKGLASVMQADEQLAPQAFIATGDACNRLADLLLQAGYRSSKKDGVNPDLPPYASAMDDYSRAVIAYSQAYDRIQIAQPSRENEALARNAGTRAFEVSSSQGDVLFAWALELRKSAAEQGNLHNTSSADYYTLLTDKIFPLMNQGLDHKAHALTLANQYNIGDQANAVRKTVDAPLKLATDDLLAACRTRWDGLKANSTQLAVSYARSSDPETGAGLAESTSKSWDSAQSCAQKGGTLVSVMYSRLRDFYLPTDSRKYWDNAVISLYDDYASLCRQTQADLAICLTSLSKSNSDAALKTRESLNKIQMGTASEEYATLVRSYDLSTQFDIASPICDHVMTRLAAIDPKKYGGILETNSASRKKP